MGAANRAATYMEHLCECPEHGYSQAERWGDSSRGTCYVECEGQTAGFFAGDRDCSSAIIDAWQEAIRGTQYEGALDGATYTGNMRSVFCDSGLFEWHGMDFIAQRGDIYLNEANHTAMCTCADPDLLAEFSLSENGGIYGESGDQTGGESLIHGYYDFPWDGILHYNGVADGDVKQNDLSDTLYDFCPTNLQNPRYRVRTKEDGWLDWMEGLYDTGGSGDNFAGIEGHTIFEIEVENLGINGWYEIFRADGSSSRNAQGNTESPITGIVFYYDTDTNATGGVYYKAVYQAHWQGSCPDWGKEEYDDEDGGAGKDEQSPIDMIRLRIERA